MAGPGRAAEREEWMPDDDFSLEVVSGGHTFDVASLGRRTAACSFGSPPPDLCVSCGLLPPTPNAVVLFCFLFCFSPFSVVTDQVADKMRRRNKILE